MVYRSGGHQGTNELIVVTLLVAAEGGVKLPNVTSLEELRTALSRLGSIGKDQVGPFKSPPTLLQTN